ncbi:MAG TPA: septal ring lytic transglycosylase RlpA family protein [Rubrivivax sp.]|nr:septal ring lytic transglycosylase RlpA family protein [Rubrivivax sp.]
MAGCSSPPLVRDTRDGPGADPPPDLASRPDPEPRIEPLRVGGPNKPYEVLGQRYVPVTSDQPLWESGGASWYGRKFHGQPTANGEIYDMYAMTAAHKTMPLPSYAVVRNPANGRQVVVRVNDRGPFVGGRVIDLSFAAATKLGLLRGVAPVEVRRLTFAEIRAGTWRREPTTVLLAASATASATTSAITSATTPATTSAAALASALAPDDPAPGEGPAATPGLWLQVASYRSRQDAQAMLQRALFEADTAVQVQPEGSVYRVWAGPFEGRERAQQAADRLRRLLGVSALMIER